MSYVLFAEYDSTYVLACKQKFAIPEDVENGDYVGVWLRNYTWLKATGTSTKAIETNFNNAFSINSSSGLITIADYTQINGKIVQQDTVINIIIRTTCDVTNIYELDTAQIWVKENSYCKFFDFQYSGTESGTRDEPYNDLDDICTNDSLTWGYRGYGLFCKRGTYATNEYTILNHHIASQEHPTIIAAYGTGSKPEFVGTSTNFGWYIGDQTGSTSNPETTKSEWVYFYDIYMRGYAYSSWYTRRKSDHIGWFNCSQTNCQRTQDLESSFVIISTFPDGGSLEDSTLVYDFEVINFYSDTVGYDNSSGSAEISYMKIGVGPTKITNCFFGAGKTDYASNSGYLLRLTAGSGSEVKHCYFENSNNVDGSDNVAVIQLRQHDAIIEDCIIQGMVNGINVTVPNASYPYTFPDSVTIKNCHFTGQSKNSIYFYSGTSGLNQSRGSIFENNIFDSPQGITTRHVNYTARYNLFIGGTGKGIQMIADGTSNNIPTLYYNVFYGYSDDILEFTYSTACYIYNNVFDGTLDFQGSGEVVRNNYFQSISSAAAESNNIDIDTINTALHFVDYAGHDYHLRSTAISAIDQGYDWGQTEDFEDNLKSGDEWDIGAYEYNYLQRNFILNGSEVNTLRNSIAVKKIRTQ